VCYEEKNRIVATQRAPAGLVADLWMTADTELAAFYTAVFVPGKLKNAPAVVFQIESAVRLERRNENPLEAPCCAVLYSLVDRDTISRRILSPEIQY
jgi:hypothetical protein